MPAYPEEANAGSADAPAARAVPYIHGPAHDYARHCQGCHGAFGYSVDEVPVLKDRVGYFARTPEGRAYLIQVPNVSQAHLSDDRLAQLMNWLLETYGKAQLPENFIPYSATEVGALRRDKPAQVAAFRRRVVAGLVAAGAVPDAAVLAFGAE